MVGGRTYEESCVMNSSSLIDSSGIPLGACFLVLAQEVQIALISSHLFSCVLCTQAKLMKKNSVERVKDSVWMEARIFSFFLQG